MNWLALFCLVVLLAMLTFQIRKDGAEYEAFKKLTTTGERQAKYREWIIKSFGMMGLGGLVALVVIGRLDSLATMPPEFALIDLGAITGGDLGEAAQGIAIGAGSGLVIALLIAAVRFRRSRGRAAMPTIGDIEALLPRNAAERVWGALLSLNAGFSEEILFRLALPLLLAIVLHSVMAAMVIALLLFGIMHRYQGWIGVVATTVLGAVMTVIYLGAQQIWVVMAIHAAIDLNGLVLMPWLRDSMKVKAV